MKTININTREGVQLLNFPDGQPHVNVSGVEEGDDITVICSITSPMVLLQLLECANALDNLFAKKKVLVIPYLLGARYDRIMVTGDSVDLKVIADLINNMNFEKVYLFDVHSEVATLLIRNAIGISNQLLVENYRMENAVLVCPDAGAAKKIHNYFKWNKGIVEVVYCSKHRDLTTGAITLNVLEPERCKDRNCVIIDDICDGGGTFLAIADQVHPKHFTLIVSHGIFSKGFARLEEKFNEIIVSNSYKDKYESSIIKIVPMTIPVKKRK